MISEEIRLWERKKIVNFLKYFRKEEPSEEYEKAKKRIYQLHDGKGNFSYIARIYPLESGGGEIQAEFVVGEHKVGETAVVYDVEGKKIGEVTITEIFTGKNEDRDQKTQGGEKGKLLFQTQKEIDEKLWEGQYLKSDC